MKLVDFQILCRVTPGDLSSRLWNQLRFLIRLILNLGNKLSNLTILLQNTFICNWMISWCVKRILHWAERTRSCRLGNFLNLDCRFSTQSHFMRSYKRYLELRDLISSLCYIRRNHLLINMTDINRIVCSFSNCGNYWSIVCWFFNFLLNHLGELHAILWSTCLQSCSSAFRNHR